MKFSESVGYLLSKVAINHRKLLEKNLRGVGLHSGQVFVLMELWKKDGQRQVDLASALDLSAPTVNKILGGLLEADFVTRARYEDDARSTRIFLTQKGIDIEQALERQWELLEEQTIMNLTDTEALLLKQLLTQMLENVEV